MPAGRAAIAPVVQGGLRPGGQVEHSGYHARPSGAGKEEKLMLPARPELRL